MRIRYTLRARADLSEIRAYLLKRNPRVAAAVLTTIPNASFGSRIFH